MPISMNLWQRWVQQPHKIGVRPFLFQIHLWLGILLAAYVVMISLTGSLLVYRREIAALNAPVRVSPGSARLSSDELTAVAERDNPGFTMDYVFVPKIRGQIVPDRAAEITLLRGKRRITHFFDPYTGADLGTTNRPVLNAIIWLADLHDDLLAGPKGRIVNGYAAILATLMACTGLVLWWPGIRKWKRGLTINWKRKGYGFNWSMHNALGFWMTAFILLWGISGIYFAFPQFFNSVVDFLEPVTAATSHRPRFGDDVLSWLAKLHFGRFPGYTVKTLWTVLGLAPALLAITGLVMWWHRVVKRALRRRRKPAVEIIAAQPAVGVISAQPAEPAAAAQLQRAAKL